MKLKRLIEFYFFADGINDALDNLITAYAVRSGLSLKGAEFFFERISKLVGDKQSLACLYERLDTVFSALTQRDRQTLFNYCLMRGGVSKLSEGERREIHRAMVKFVRRGQVALAACEKYYSTLSAYYCLLKPS